MGGKVSVTSASGATPTRSSEQTANRDASNPLTASNSFSSALGAAQPANAPARATDPSNGRTDASQGTSAGAKKPNNAAATSAGASSASASNSGASNPSASTISASTIEDAIAAQGNQLQGKSGGKARSGDAAGSATAPPDPDSLASLLAGTGLQIDGSNSSGSQSSQTEDSSGKSDADTAAQAAAAGAMAVSTTLAATVASLMGMSPTGPTTSNAKQSDTGAVGSATSGGSTAGVDDTLLIKFDSLSVGMVSSDDATGTLQFPRMAATDAQSDQSGAAGSGLADMVRGLTSAPTPSASVERTVSVPVGDPNWPGALAGHVQWLVNNNVQSATLQLSPDHLGPVEVRIDVQQSQVNVSFSALHPDTRSALEQSVPRLREIFAGGGLTLGQATVQQETRSGSHFSAPTSHTALTGSQNGDSISIPRTQALGLLDEYA